MASRDLAEGLADKLHEAVREFTNTCINDSSVKLVDMVSAVSLAITILQAAHIKSIVNVFKDDTPDKLDKAIEHHIDLLHKMLEDNE